MFSKLFFNNNEFDKATSHELQQAIKNNSTQRCLELLQSGVDLSGYGFLLLLEALILGNVEIIEILLKYGAHTDINSFYRINSCCEENTFFALMIRRDNDMNSSILDLVYLFVETEWSSWSKFCEIMIKLGFDINNDHVPEPNHFGSITATPLFIAVKCRNTSTIQTLLELGANPLQKCDIGREGQVPLEHSFSLPAYSIENIVKYAALQLGYASDKEVYMFFVYFFEDNSRSYMNFGHECFAEIRILKNFIIDTNDSNLYDFIVSQGEKLRAFLGDNEVKNNVLNILSSTSLPIYRNVIMRKFGRYYLLKNLLEFTNLRWYTSHGGKEISLNADCVRSVFKFLNVDDLGSLLIAFNSVT